VRIGILISGNGSNLEALIDSQSNSNESTEIVIVISNVDNARGLKIAAEHGIPTQIIKHQDYLSRDEFDIAMHRCLTEANVDLICLAGFMRIIGDVFVNKWPNKILNIHPSLLPAFKGLNTHERALKSGVKFTGCTTHFVRPALDEEPIIMQAVVPILAGDDKKILAERVLKQEHIIYPKTLSMIANGRISVSKNLVKILNANVQSTEYMINPLA